MGTYITENQRKMNEIEQLFFDAFNEIVEKEGDESDIGAFDLYPQFAIGISVVDFVIGNCAIEIDGHEYHKTKEQREKDYQKERYLLRHGYIPVRFTGTEVFLHPHKCVIEAVEIACGFESESIKTFQDGIEFGMKRAGKERGDGLD